jgi:curved DNA-binding protein CbpA
MQTHYDVLGVSWKSNDDEIRAAFRRSVKACHPDLHAGDRNAERQLRQVLAAYEILRRPQRRQIYDRLLRAERSARVQHVALTAFTGLVCCSVIAALTMWLPRLPDASSLMAAVAAPPETVRVAVADVANVAFVEVADRVVRAEVNSSSKSDRIASAPIRQAISEDAQPAQRTANNQRTANQRTADNARPPARRAEPRLAREWGQVRESDDPMAIAAFAARHPDASESKLARSKLIGLIETADDVALLNILGLGTGDIAERAQERLSRLHAATNAREDAEQTPSDNLNERAASFVSARVIGWSSANGVSLASHANAYADEVVYNGSRKSKQAIVREKRRLLELWPERSYEVRPDSVTVRCLASVCRVGGLVDWQTRNVARAMLVTGTSRFEFEVAFARGSFRILSESSTELRRPRQAASCASKSTDAKAASKAAMSRTIKDIHRDAAHCLQVASRTSPAKLKTALLAQAHLLQRAQEQRTQAEQTLASTFAERWTMREFSLR